MELTGPAQRLTRGLPVSCVYILEGVDHVTS